MTPGLRRSPFELLTRAGAFQQLERLIEVRGIGRWTVEMLLIFQLGRPDVLPVHDCGVRKGFRIAYGRRTLPTPKEVLRYAERWKPYRRGAAWYLWRAAGRAKSVQAVPGIYM